MNIVRKTLLRWLGAAPVEAVSFEWPKTATPPELLALMARVNTMADDLQSDREQGLRDLKEARDAIAALAPILTQARLAAEQAMAESNAGKYETLLDDPELQRLMAV